MTRNCCRTKCRGSVNWRMCCWSTCIISPALTRRIFWRLCTATGIWWLPMWGMCPLSWIRRWRRARRCCWRGSLGRWKIPTTAFIPWWLPPPRWRPTAPSAQGCPPMRSGRSSPCVRLILRRWGQEPSCPRSLERKPTNCVPGAATAGSSAPPQAGPGGWDGSTVWLPGMAAVCRALRTWHSLCWMCWGIWMRFPSV